MLYFINDIKNRFDFFMRNHIRFSRENYNEIPQSLDGILKNEKQEKFSRALTDKYEFILSHNYTSRNFLLNLYYLNIFDKFFSKRANDTLSVLDIGSKNWEYVKSEYVFFKSFVKNPTLNGIELDAYRMCSNFYNRYEIAKFYTKNLFNTNYIVGDFIKHQQKYDYIVWILPFITKYPLLKWGLPLKYFKPQDMLVHAYSLLNPNGELLIINQGKNEYQIQQELAADTIPEAEYVLFGEIDDVFGLFKNKRYCSKLVKV